MKSGLAPSARRRGQPEDSKKPDERKADTTASRPGMVLADRKAWRKVEERGKAESHCEECQERRMAEGQAAQTKIRNLLFCADRPGSPLPWAPFYKERNQ